MLTGLGAGAGAATAGTGERFLSCQEPAAGAALGGLVPVLFLSPAAQPYIANRKALWVLLAGG